MIVFYFVLLVFVTAPILLIFKNDLIFTISISFIFAGFLLMTISLYYFGTYYKCKDCQKPFFSNYMDRFNFGESALRVLLENECIHCKSTLK